MSARRDLYAALMAGGPHSPDRSEKASALIDAYRVDVLSKAGVEYEDCDVCGAARSVGKPCNTCAFRADIAAELAGREQATAAAVTATPDTLAAWLRQRFTASSVSWDNLDDTERDYWEHQALAVRRAVDRGGFRTANPEAGDDRG